MTKGINHTAALSGSCQDLALSQSFASCEQDDTDCASIISCLDSSSISQVSEVVRPSSTLKIAMSLSKVFQEMTCPACGNGPYMSAVLPARQAFAQLPGKFVQEVNRLSEADERPIHRFDGLSKEQQKALIRYCRLTSSSYAERPLSQSELIGVRHGAQSRLPAWWQHEVNQALIFADNAVEKSTDAATPTRFVPIDLTESQTTADPLVTLLASQLLKHGFSLGGQLGNSITTEAGLAAKIYHRLIDENTLELVLSFPGLGVMGLDQSQQEGRLTALLTNLSGDSLLHLQAQQLASLLGDFKEGLQTDCPERCIEFTATGHSLGGGLAMVAVNVSAVDQAVVFQPYPALAGKLDSAAANKVVQVMVQKKNGGAFALASDGLIPAFVQHYHSGTHKIIADAHELLDSKAYVPHSAILSHLLLNFQQNGFDLDEKALQTCSVQSW